MTDPQVVDMPLDVSILPGDEDVTALSLVARRPTPGLTGASDLKKAVLYLFSANVYSRDVSGGILPK